MSQRTDTERLDWYQNNWAHIGVTVAPSGAVAVAYRRWIGPNQPREFATLRAAIDAAMDAASQSPVSHPDAGPEGQR